MMQRVDALAAELKRRDERDRRRRNVGLKSSDSTLTEASMESRPSRHSKAPTASPTFAFTAASAWPAPA